MVLEKRDGEDALGIVRWTKEREWRYDDDLDPMGALVWQIERDWGSKNGESFITAAWKALSPEERYTVYARLSGEGPDGCAMNAAMNLLKYLA